MKKFIAALIRGGLIFLLSAIAEAGSAQWDLNPGSGDWNTAGNWTPMTVPNASTDTATFDLSNTTAASVSANTEVNGITFTAAATTPYTITANPDLTLTLSGTGITNNSGTTQNFVTAVNGAGNAGSIRFTNSASAGSQTAFINKGATGSLVNGGFMEFLNSSTAGHGTFTNNGGVNPDGSGGFIVFNDTSTAGNGIFTNNGGTTRAGSSAAGGGDTEFQGSSTAGNGTFTNNAGFGQFGSTRFGGSSTAGNATITNKGGTPSASAGGLTFFSGTSTAGSATINNNGATFAVVAQGEVGTTEFDQSSTAGSATINNNGGTVSGASGGLTRFFGFFGAPTAGSATIINNGGTVSGAGGGETIFSDFSSTSTAGNSTLIANGGVAGGQGGTILFEDHSTGGTSRVEVFGNGNLDISFHHLTIGSIEGDGVVFLGAKPLTVGSNNLSTTFSGVMQDGGQFGGTGGSLTKIGTGTLTLSGVNTYSGNTNIYGGVLKVDGSITSNTFVHRAGTLAGTGTVHGNVTSNGTGSPGAGPGTLTVNNNYTQGSKGRLLIDIAGPNTGQFSVLDVLGNANLNGLLYPVLSNFTPTIGESFTFLDYASLTGAFSGIQKQVFDHGLEQWSVTYQSTNAILTAEAGPAIPTAEAAPANVPDRGSTLLLLTLSLFGLVTYRQKCW
jgi:autotransporter-associated beta strand protein